MKDKTVEYYDKNAELWAARKTDSFFHEVPFRLFESKLKDGDTILDIGCAYGIHVPLFLGIGRKLKYEGIDISESMIKIAKSRYPQLSFKVGDVMNIEGGKKYDGFLAAAVLMHIPMVNWEKMLESIENNMNPGAIGYITLPEERPNPENENDQRHFEYFNQDKFKEIAKGRNWEVLESGFFEKTPGHAPWHWFIVKLP